MARVVAFIPDLMFGSRVQAELLAAGHTVDLVAAGDSLRGVLGAASLLVVDLTDESSERTELVDLLSTDGSLDGVRTLAFYSHVDINARRQAESVGFDMIVARSRMAREGPELVSRLAQEEPETPR